MLVYYVIISGGDGRSERQWVQSVRSLRRYNTNVPILVFAFNGLAEEIRQEAQCRNVIVYDLGGYRSQLSSSHLYGDVFGDVLSAFPTLAKFFVLPGEIRGCAAERILYLDCDTFFFDDVAVLFESYDRCDWYAREEPLSRRSPWGYDPRHIDEDALATLALAEGAVPVAPFNSGVCLFSGSLAARLDALHDIFLDLVWRMLVNLAIGAKAPIEPELRASILRIATDYDRVRALSYPSENAWIVEQIALWLTLGQLPRLSSGRLTSQHVLQSTEFEDAFRKHRHFVVCHYFSVGEAAFFAAVDRL